MTKEEKEKRLALERELMREEAYRAKNDRLWRCLQALEQEQRCAKRRLWLAVAAFPVGVLVGGIAATWIGR